MLVLHPSSRCDVCLEPYTQDSLARSPHAVPCGHVFCRTCLLAIIPPNCPLCRKPYLPDRVKKLIVDKLEDMDDQLQGDSRRENELLRRLMVCWDESDDRLVDLTREVDMWLQGRAVSHPALKKARAALAEYQKLKSRRERDKLTIKALKERERVNTAERDETQAIEQSLLVQISQLEAKLAESETNRQTLQTQVARYKLKNPLPQPPEIPIPFDQLTVSGTTPRASGSVNLYSVPEAGPSPSRWQSHNNGSVVQADHRFLTPFYAPAPNSQPPSQPYPPESDRDRKGKRKAREGSSGRHSSASVYTNGHSFIPSNSHPNGVLSDDENSSVIYPGAVTQRRVIPPKEVTISNTPFPPSSNGDGTANPVWGEEASNADPGVALRPYSLAALYIGEYVNGYGEGYNAATGENTHATSSQAMGPDHGWNTTSQDGTPRVTWTQTSAEIAHNDSHSLTAGHDSWQGGRTADSGNDSSEERLVYAVNGLGHRSVSSNIDSNTNYAGSAYASNSSLSLASRSNVNGTSNSRLHRSHRRRATGFIPGHETDVESVRRTRDEPVIPPTQRPNSVSVPSWNLHPPIATTATTIATASTVNRTRPRHTHHAGNGLNELTLASFGPESMYPSPPGDTPRSTLSSLGLHTFPVREDDEIVMERLPSAGSESRQSVVHMPGQQTTPRQRHVSFDHRPTLINAGNVTTTIAQATIATSNVSAIVHTTAHASTTFNESRNASRNAHRRSGRYGTTQDYTTQGRSSISASGRSSSSALAPTSAVPAPPAVTILGSPTAMEDAMHLAAAEMPRPLPRTPPRLRNALGLQLDVGERAENATPAGGISAPMPVVSAGRFLRSWSLGES